MQSDTKRYKAMKIGEKRGENDQKLTNNSKLIENQKEIRK